MHMKKINKYCCRMWLCLSLPHRGHGSCGILAMPFDTFVKLKSLNVSCARYWSQHKFITFMCMCVCTLFERCVLSVIRECHCAFAQANVSSLALFFIHTLTTTNTHTHTPICEQTEHFDRFYTWMYFTFIWSLLRFFCCFPFQTHVACHLNLYTSHNINDDMRLFSGCQKASCTPLRKSSTEGSSMQIKYFAKAQFLLLVHIKPWTTSPSKYKRIHASVHSQYGYI